MGLKGFDQQVVKKTSKKAIKAASKAKTSSVASVGVKVALATSLTFGGIIYISNNKKETIADKTHLKEQDREQYIEELKTKIVDTYNNEFLNGEYLFIVENSAKKISNLCDELLEYSGDIELYNEFYDKYMISYEPLMFHAFLSIDKRKPDKVQYIRTQKSLSESSRYILVGYFENPVNHLDEDVFCYRVFGNEVHGHHIYRKIDYNYCKVKNVLETVIEGKEYIIIYSNFGQTLEEYYEDVESYIHMEVNLLDDSGDYCDETYWYIYDKNSNSIDENNSDDYIWDIDYHHELFKYADGDFMEYDDYLTLYRNK